MITGLDIKGFKKFVHLSIHQLSRVNLVGGRNNIGKTSLLEAIFLFFDRMNPHMVTNQFARRGVSILPLEPETLWSPIFFNYEIKHGISISVTYGKITETMNITYNPNYLPALVRANKAAASGRQLQIKTDQKPMPSYALDIVYKTNGIKGASHLTVGVEGLGLQVEKMKATKMQATIIPSRYISPPNEDAERYGKLDVAGEENDILEFLRIIEPNLKGLSSVTMGNISMVHGDIGLQRKIPVPYMGEGVAKLLSIILAIANTKGGIVLIDEFENGLHYSVMQKVWEGIGKAAKKYDCQVIATTHSYECLDAAYKGFSGDLAQDFSYLRLDSFGDETKAKIFDYEMLKVAIESNMEVR